MLTRKTGVEKYTVLLTFFIDLYQRIDKDALLTALHDLVKMLDKN